MPDKQSLTAILENPHFNQFAALLSMAMSPKWRMAHPEVPSVRSTIEERLARLNRGMLKDATNIQASFVSAWTDLLTSIIDADKSLYYTTQDYQWFLRVLDGDDSEARMTFSMLFAVASTRRTWYSADEVAAMPDSAGKTRAASTWRNLAAEGKVIGAFKVGGEKAAWMFPELSLRAMGVQVPGTSIEIVNENEEE